MYSMRTDNLGWAKKCVHHYEKGGHNEQHFFTNLLIHIISYFITIG